MPKAWAPADAEIRIMPRYSAGGIKRPAPAYNAANQYFSESPDSMTPVAGSLRGRVDDKAALALDICRRERQAACRIEEHEVTWLKILAVDKLRRKKKDHGPSAAGPRERSLPEGVHIDAIDEARTVDAPWPVAASVKIGRPKIGPLADLHYPRSCLFGGQRRLRAPRLKQMPAPMVSKAISMSGQNGSCARYWLDWQTLMTVLV